MSEFCSRYVLVALLNLLPYLVNETVIVGVCFQKLFNKVNRFFSISATVTAIRK